MDAEIAISIDPDWAPEAVVQDTLDLLRQHRANATLFMTNVLDLDLSGHEIAIHPHFESFDYESHLRARLTQFPDAIGTRSHSLFDTQRLQEIYERLGIRYQSNVLMYREPNLRPYRVSRTVVELPIFWMDNVYMMMEGEGASFALTDLKIEEPGLKLFCFHPIHIFLNSPSMRLYNDAKPYYKSPHVLLQHRNTRERGVRDVFLELLQYVEDKRLATRTLSDIAAGFAGGKAVRASEV
jgi:peptidoglycan/xylan/chitin deacetylase (PgdA/CDA1 family)